MIKIKVKVYKNELIKYYINRIDIIKVLIYRIFLIYNKNMKINLNKNYTFC